VITGVFVGGGGGWADRSYGDSFRWLVADESYGLQVSMFFALTTFRVVKLTRSSSEMVL
jgi:hypothetical protein